MVSDRSRVRICLSLVIRNAISDVPSPDPGERQFERARMGDVETVRFTVPR